MFVLLHSSFMLDENQSFPGFLSTTFALFYYKKATDFCHLVRAFSTSHNLYIDPSPSLCHMNKRKPRFLNRKIKSILKYLHVYVSFLHVYCHIGDPDMIILCL
jgi:hypothetical protein